ncbi:MAG: PilZ domain-containing protein [Fimbriimonadia bacterium]|jgi:hypothetical protein
MSTNTSALDKLKPGLPVDLVAGAGGTERRISRFILVEPGEAQLRIKPANDERIRSLPKVGSHVGLLVHCGRSALKAQAIITGTEGSRIDPLVTVTIGTDWTELVHRSSERLPADFPADVHIPDPHRTGQVSIMRGRVIDLSISGCRVRLAKCLAKGTMLALSFTLPGSTRKVALMGQVVRSTSCPDQATFSDVGMRFVHIGQDERDVLNEWISESLMAQVA